MGESQFGGHESTSRYCRWLDEQDAEAAAHVRRLVNKALAAEEAAAAAAAAATKAAEEAAAATKAAEEAAAAPPPSKRRRFSKALRGCVEPRTDCE